MLNSSGGWKREMRANLFLRQLPMVSHNSWELPEQSETYLNSQNNPNPFVIIWCDKKNYDSGISSWSLFSLITGNNLIFICLNSFFMSCCLSCHLSTVYKSWAGHYKRTQNTGTIGDSWNDIKWKCKDKLWLHYELPSQKKYRCQSVLQIKCAWETFRLNILLKSGI